MLKAANLDSSHERLIKATITDLVYDDVRQKLIKVFAEESIEGDLKNSISSIKIKAEPSFYAKVIKMITNKRHQMKKGYIIRSSYRTVWLCFSAMPFDHGDSAAVVFIVIPNFIGKFTAIIDKKFIT